MKLSDQCCTREQAQRLKELGIDQDSVFIHFKAASHAGICQRGTRYVWAVTGNPYDAEDIEDWAAFSVAELGQMLPDYTHKLGNLEIGKSETDHISMKPKKEKWWNVSYWTLSGRVERDLYIPEQKSKHLQQAATLAQTLAKMLIYLLENNLLSVSEVNERIKG